MFSKICVRSFAFVAVNKFKYIHQDEEHRQLGLDCVRQTYALVKDSDWKIEKITKSGDTVSSVQHQEWGKMYKLRCRVNYPAKALCNEFYFKLEDMPHWNPTLDKAKIIQNIATYTDIIHNVSAPFCGGLIKSRDFVNLRCCRLLVNGEISESKLELDSTQQKMLKLCCENNISAISKGDDSNAPIQINSWPADNLNNGRVWILTALSVEYDKVPATDKYIRGHNFVSGYAIHEIEGQPNECIFEWILCVDFKGSLPRYIVNMAYTTSMPDFAKCLRKYVKELYRRHSSPTPSSETKEIMQGDKAQKMVQSM